MLNSARLPRGPASPLPPLSAPSKGRCLRPAPPPQSNVHVVAVVQTQNADSAVTALNTDTIYSLLSPAGIAVVPGSVKAMLGLPAPTPAPGAAATTITTTTATPTDSSSSSSSGSTQAAAAPSPTGGSSSSIGAIVGGVVGGLAVVAIGVTVFVVSCL